MKLVFDESDATLLTEALFGLKKVKQLAFEALNAELKQLNRPLFSEREFGIPLIEDLIDRINEAEDE